MLVQGHPGCFEGYHTDRLQSLQRQRGCHTDYLSVPAYAIKQAGKQRHGVYVYVTTAWIVAILAQLICHNFNITMIILNWNNLLQIELSVHFIATIQVDIEHNPKNEENVAMSSRQMSSIVWKIVPGCCSSETRSCQSAASCNSGLISVSFFSAIRTWWKFRLAPVEIPIQYSLQTFQHDTSFAVLRDLTDDKSTLVQVMAWCC